MHNFQPPEHVVTFFSFFFFSCWVIPLCTKENVLITLVATVNIFFCVNIQIIIKLYIQNKLGEVVYLASSKWNMLYMLHQTKNMLCICIYGAYASQLVAHMY